MNSRAHLPRVSVVIPTFRRPQLLERCLNALTAQSLPGDAFEIIAVDDGRTESTRILCERMAAEQSSRNLVISYLRPQKTRGPAAARNYGWRAARARLIAFTDDDTIPDSQWLAHGEAAMEAPLRLAAWGYVHVPLPAALTDHARNTSGLENAVFVTANVFVRRWALETVGGFDERYQRAWREDTDLHFALLALASWPGAVVSAPQALVVHPVREAKFLVSIGQQANMAFDPLLYKKFPSLYDRHIGFRHPPLNYSAIAIATFLSLATLPFWAPAAIGCAIVALALILQFAARRLSGLAKTPRSIADMVLSSFVVPYVSLYWRFVGAVRWRAKFY